MLKHPWRRNHLINYLETLSDKEKQTRRWVQHIYPPAIPYDDLDYTIHFLYDDTWLADDPVATIGYLLLNHREANLVKKLIEAFEVVFAKYGMHKTDEEYINCPEWQAVIDEAKKLLDLIKQNDSNTSSFFDRLSNIIEDGIFIGITLDDLETELKNNTWFLSASQQEVKVLGKEILAAFFDKVIENRLKQIKNTPEKHGMIFYMWFDEQASQIRFSLISDFHESLPFGNPRLIFLDTPDLIYEQFLDSEYHDGIPFSELEISDWDSHENETDDAHQPQNLLNVYKVLLKYQENE